MILSDLGNRVAVQLFKRLPWLGEAWARRRRFVESDSVPWTPMGKPVRQSVIALVTTAGVHRRADPPFDMTDPDGDPSFRVVPVDAPRGEVMITHKYYDHSAADRDLNVVLPVDRLRELHAAGHVGGGAAVARRRGGGGRPHPGVRALQPDRRSGAAGDRGGRHLDDRHHAAEGDHPAGAAAPGALP